MNKRTLNRFIAYPLTEEVSMQIRMKHNHQHAVTALERVPSGGYRWESRGPVDGTLLLHHQDEWEVVPTEKQWKDVTSRVALVELVRSYGIRLPDLEVIELPTGYRFKRDSHDHLIVEQHE